MIKTILITGSNGLLGQKLVQLLKKQYNVIATSLGDSLISDKSSFTYLSLDITKEKDVLQVFEKYKPHYLINTAAMTNVDGCEDNKQLCDKINVIAVDYLSKLCKKYKTHIIHISTDFIFDGKNGPYHEDDDANPLSYYGLSKWKSEQILQQSGCLWSILRTIIIYGTGENLRRNNIVLWGRKALKEGKKLNIIDDQFRSPTLAEDLAEACRLVIEKGALGIYNISGKEIMSIYEMVERMAVFYKCNKSQINKISTSTLNQKAQRPLKTGFILNKSIKKLGYNPHSFEEGLALLEKQLN